MYIDCAGMRRSGSTLQYNIIAEILKLKNVGQTLGWEHGSAFSVIKSKYQPASMNLFKNHILSDEILQELRNTTGSVVLYVFRDIRDVCVSIMDKENKTFEQVFNSGVLQKAIEEYELVTNADIHKYIQSYELMFMNNEREIVSLSEFLGINLTEEEVGLVYNEVSIDKQLQNIENYKRSDDFVVKHNQKFHPKTLLHHNHIKDGGIEKYKSRLDREQIEILEKEFGDWLVANNYQLSNYSDDEKQTRCKKGSVKYYSQHGEDYLLWNFFDHKENGFFIEVGAFDGVHLSNSYSFENNGWNGICIEPGQYFENCKSNRKNALCLRLACVADEEISEVSFFQEPLGLLSSLSMDDEKLEDIKSRYENRKIDFKGVEQHTVPCSTLNKILADQEQEIDFITIDVEGNELDVLKGFDLSKYKPQVVVIEANEKTSENKLINYLTVKNRYLYARKVGVNLVFVRSVGDFFKIRGITIDCFIEPQCHPKGFDYTLAGYADGVYIQDGKKVKLSAEVGYSKSNTPESNIELPIDSESSPILVYQVGKVGSSTIYNSLKDRFHDVPIYQVHNINLAESLFNLEKIKNHKGGVHHFLLGRDLNKIIREKPDIRWRIIVGVREPIKRWISDIFQNMEERYDFLINSGGHVNLFALSKYVRSTLFEEPMQKWFKDELETVFGIDVFEYPFNQDLGYQVIKSGNVELLLYQLEKLSEVSEQMFDEFLSVKNFELLNVNKTTNKAYSNDYQQALCGLKFDDEFIQHFYDNDPITHHFYSQSSINEFKQQWTRDITIDELREIKEKDEEIFRLKKLIESHETRREERDKEISQLKKLIESHETSLVQRDKEISQLKKLIESHEANLVKQNEELLDIKSSKKYKLAQMLAYPYLAFSRKQNKS